MTYSNCDDNTSTGLCQYFFEGVLNPLSFFRAACPLSPQTPDVPSRHRKSCPKQESVAAPFNEFKLFFIQTEKNEDKGLINFFRSFLHNAFLGIVWGKNEVSGSETDSSSPEIFLFSSVRQLPFDDIRVRKVMQMALDLDTITNTFFKGEASATPQGLVGVKGYFIPFEEWPEAVKQGYCYDPEGARQLLAEAGYPDGFKTTLNYSLWSDLGYVEIAVAYWAAIGVDVEIDVLDYGVYHERLFSRTYEGMASAIAGAIYAPATLASWYHSDNQWNRPGSQWPEMDALVEAFQAATTIEE